MSSSVYPTGVTIFNPEKCWNGYTVFQAIQGQAKNIGATLIDMNGQVVNQWRGLEGIPNKMLPGGYIMGGTGERNPKYGSQDMLDLVLVDQSLAKDPSLVGGIFIIVRNDFNVVTFPLDHQTPGLIQTLG